MLGELNEEPFPKTPFPGLSLPSRSTAKFLLSATPSCAPPQPASSSAAYQLLQKRPGLFKMSSGAGNRRHWKFSTGGTREVLNQLFLAYLQGPFTALSLSCIPSFGDQTTETKDPKKSELSRETLQGKRKRLVGTARGGTCLQERFTTCACSLAGQKKSQTMASRTTPWPRSLAMYYRLTSNLKLSFVRNIKYESFSSNAIKLLFKTTDK